MAATLRPLLSLPQLSTPDRQRVAVNVLIESDRVELLAGAPKRVPVARSGSKRQQIYRCPECDTAVWSTYRASIRCSFAPELSMVRLMWNRMCTSSRGRRSLRLTLPESTPAFATYYDTQRLWPAASIERVEALQSR